MADSEEKIRCPKCKWEPHAADLWQCSCGTFWNTFTTYGQCPSCKKVWKDTQCPACWKWSPHADWYVDLQNISIETTIDEKAEN